MTSPESPPPSARRSGLRDWIGNASYFVVLLIWPALALLRMPADPLEFAWQIESNRLGAYIASFVFLWCAFILIWLIQRVEGQRLHQLGFTLPVGRDFVAGILFLVIAYPLLGLFAWLLSLAGFAIPELVIRALLPGTTAERVGWVMLSISAGVCEETIFRGYLLTKGEQLLRRRWAAVVLSACAFGIGHVYQGIAGVVLVGVYGLMFTWLRYRTGNLWSCIVAHALQDILAVYFATFNS